MQCMSAIWSPGSCFKAARRVMKNSSSTWKGKTARSLNYASNLAARAYELAGNETRGDSRKLGSVSERAHT